MSKNPYMKLYVADYLRDTQHLTAEQHGAYLLLLMAMWTRGGALPYDPSQLARVCRVALQRWSKISPQVLNYFRMEGDHLTHNRIQKDLEHAAEVSFSKSQNGKRGGRPKSLKDKEPAKANAKHPVPILVSYESKQSSSPLVSLPREDDADDFEKLDRDLRSIPGITCHPVSANLVIAPIWQLARSGVGVRKVILPSIARQVAVAKGPIRSWVYFVPGIQQDAAGSGGDPSATKRPVVDRKKWKIRLHSARLRKAWPVADWGPMPGTPECTCPADLIEPDDGNGWTIKFETAA